MIEQSNEFENKDSKSVNFLDMKKVENMIVEEIKGLRRNTSSDEKHRINIKTFNANDISQSLYGQLTGSRVSERAFELSNICGGEYSKSISTYIPVEISFEMKVYDKQNPRNYTALEMYLAKCNNEKGVQVLVSILNFIKGNTNKIEL